MSDADDGRTPEPASLRGRERWAELLAASPSDANDIATRFVEEIGSEDIDALLWYARSGSALELERALLTLIRAARRENLMSHAQRQAMVDAAIRAGREHYPYDLLGSVALRIAFEHDRGAAGRLLEAQSEIDIQTLAPVQRRRLISDLAMIATPAAFERLKSWSALTGEIGDDAIDALARHGVVAPQTLHAAAESWRRERTAAALSRFSRYYFDNLREGAPLAGALDLLGEPTGHAEVDYWYDASDKDVRLWFQGDAKRGIFAWKLMD